MALDTDAIGQHPAQIELRHGQSLRRRLAIHLDRLAIVPLHAPGIAVAVAQFVLRPGVALFGRLGVPVRRFRRVARHADAVGIGDAEISTGQRHPALSRVPEHVRGLRDVTIDTAAALINYGEIIDGSGDAGIGGQRQPLNHFSQRLRVCRPRLVELGKIELGRVIALRGRCAKQLLGPGEVDRHTDAMQQHPAEFILCSGLVMMNRFLVPIDRDRDILVDVAAVGVERAQLVFRQWVVLVGGTFEQLKGFALVLFDAKSVKIQNRQIVQRERMVLIGQRLIDLGGFDQLAGFAERAGELKFESGCVRR
ncbi:hypothetical protein [Bradyrhizobium sp. AS23.2]|uniref:hypothetical protein n=1 Tax=Bradyrhizobium sp. AS23.2 TaxID=1680155 RepID=UPI001FD92194|nr:hypothetical protein [Bradyrhizobium sp. AS23.2]